MGTLEAIAHAAEIEPPELPRLTSGDVFVAYSQMGKQIEMLLDAYKKLPDATQKDCTYQLTLIMQACDNVGKKAKRLLEANK